MMVTLVYGKSMKESNNKFTENDKKVILVPFQPILPQF